jgi:hypothetical protein
MRPAWILAILLLCGCVAGPPTQDTAPPGPSQSATGTATHVTPTAGATWTTSPTPSPGGGGCREIVFGFTWTDMRAWTAMQGDPPPNVTAHHPDDDSARMIGQFVPDMPWGWASRVTGGGGQSAASAWAVLEAANKTGAGPGANSTWLTATLRGNTTQLHLRAWHAQGFEVPSHLRPAMARFVEDLFALDSATALQWADAWLQRASTSSGHVDARWSPGRIPVLQPLWDRLRPEAAQPPGPARAVAAVDGSWSFQVVRPFVSWEERYNLLSVDAEGRAHLRFASTLPEEAGEKAQALLARWGLPFDGEARPQRGDQCH